LTIKLRNDVGAKLASPTAMLSGGTNWARQASPLRNYAACFANFIRAYFYDYETHVADPYGDYSPAKNANTDVWDSAQYTGKGSALIKPAGSGARRRYILLEYKN
jgi:hypothetical protein